MSRSVTDSVREKYAEAARQASRGERSSCAQTKEDGSGCCGASDTPITGELYDETETRDLPRTAVLGSLGCGNPTALAELRPGEVVLDLGSGGGLDVLLSARRVGPTGKAYGLDMTDEMLELARKNQEESGLENVEFLKGQIEEIPLPDRSVDVVISNCVINLSADKPTALREAFRVLRPGGRFAVSDIVVRGAPPAEVRRSVELWVGCVAGAMEESELHQVMEEVGFEDVEIEPTRVYRADDVRALLAGSELDAEALIPQVDGSFMAAFIRGRRPLES